MVTLGNLEAEQEAARRRAEREARKAAEEEARKKVRHQHLRLWCVVLWQVWLKD